MLKVYDNFNPQILKHIPVDAQHVLEIGCDTGKLGEAFKAGKNGVEWVGVDINPQSVALAETRLDLAIVGDANNLIESLQSRLGSFDCLVYGDVLEHLVDPWESLKAHCDLLCNDATVVTCIPNIHHWSVVRKLVSSEWQYTSKGILDKTHLRFFGRQGIEELFEFAGLNVTRIKPLIFKENDDAFIEGLAAACERAGAEFNREALMAFQYIAIGQKQVS